MTGSGNPLITVLRYFSVATFIIGSSIVIEKLLSNTLALTRGRARRVGGFMRQRCLVHVGLFLRLHVRSSTIGSFATAIKLA